jgi:hypothetical protein
MRDGNLRTAEIPVPRTMAGSLDRAEVIAKFLTLTEGIVTRDRADAVIDRTLALETLSDIGSLTDLLTDEVGCAFD